MKCYVGIDLGSTTTKAIVMDGNQRIIGRGITNSRSNYDVACQVAKTEALIDARFTLLREQTPDFEGKHEWFIRLKRAFTYEQYLEQLAIFMNNLRFWCKDERYESVQGPLQKFLRGFETQARDYGEELYLGDETPKSDFFRDIIGFFYTGFANKFSQEGGCSFDTLLGLFDKSIIQTENSVLEMGFQENLNLAYDKLFENQPEIPVLAEAVHHLHINELEEMYTVGTGYGRQRLPFPKEQIRSEILCHGLGAHYMFPQTRTVLDIGGQDTKAIQVDGRGIVTSFQMNDRCAAGCGRYLGYIAEEMNVSLQELGPMAMTAKKAIKINSTCTVFAGAELRDRLSDGQKREDILLGLHKAIIYRAMSLLARSGGIENEFTFTGGVAKNEAAVYALKLLLKEHYGKDIVVNIAPDSIYTGAIGAAIFSNRADLANHETGKIAEAV